MQFFVRGKRDWVPVPDVFVFQWRDSDTGLDVDADEELSPPNGTLGEKEYRAILSLYRAASSLPGGRFTKMAPDLSERLQDCCNDLGFCHAVRNDYQRDLQIEEEDFLVTQGILEEPYGCPERLTEPLLWQRGVKSVDELPAADLPMTYRYVTAELAYFVRGKSQWLRIADARILHWEHLSESMSPRPTLHRKKDLRVRKENGEHDGGAKAPTGASGGKSRRSESCSSIRLWQQASEWDCAPVTIVNALRLLNPAEGAGSISGDVLKGIWRQCLDSLPGPCEAPVGTTRGGLGAVADWLTGRKVASPEENDGKEFSVKAEHLVGRAASRRISMGPSLPIIALCVRTLWYDPKSTDQRLEGHFVLFLDDDEASDWVFLYDPYPVRQPTSSDPWRPAYAEVGGFGAAWKRKELTGKVLLTLWDRKNVSLAPTQPLDAIEDIAVGEHFVAWVGIQSGSIHRRQNAA